MDYNLLIIEVIDIVKYKFLGIFNIKKKKKSLIQLIYNINENRFYYVDNNKSIPTKKDLSRSIEIIYNIYNRYIMLDRKESFKIVEDNLEEFYNKITTKTDYSSYQSLLYGTVEYDLFELNAMCSDLGIFNNFECPYYEDDDSSNSFFE